MIIIDIVGWLGAVSLLAGYVLITTRKISAASAAFALLNTFGSIALIINSSAHSAWPSATLNIIWLVIAATALGAASKTRPPPQRRRRFTAQGEPPSIQQARLIVPRRPHQTRKCRFQLRSSRIRTVERSVPGHRSSCGKSVSSRSDG